MEGLKRFGGSDESIPNGGDVNTNPIDRSKGKQFDIINWGAAIQTSGLSLLMVLCVPERRFRCRSAMFCGA